MKLNSLYFDDCRNVLSTFPDNCVDLFITSPPYADRRKKTYGGIPENKYIEWFLPIAKEIKRTLKPTGSFFLNIKPHTKNGERSLYVFDLVIALKHELGFLFVDDYCWVKNAFPTGTHGRFKNGWEPVYHFTKGNPNQITFNPLACGTPILEETLKRAYRKDCGSPQNGSGMVMVRNNLKTIEIARPSNVIKVNNVVNQWKIKTEHSATYPEGLVDFFVKSFTNEGDLVIDPFAGSSTTAISCIENKRNWIMIENNEKEFDVSKRNIEQKLKI